MPGPIHSGSTSPTTAWIDSAGRAKPDMGPACLRHCTAEAPTIPASAIQVVSGCRAGQDDGATLDREDMPRDSDCGGCRQRCRLTAEKGWFRGLSPADRALAAGPCQSRAWPPAWSVRVPWVRTRTVPDSPPPAPLLSLGVSRSPPAKTRLAALAVLSPGIHTCAARAVPSRQ